MYEDTTGQSKNAASRPAVCLVCDRRDRAAIEAGVTAAGYRTVDPDAVGSAPIVVVDSSLHNAHEVIADAVAANRYVVAFQADVDDLVTAGLSALGAVRVIDRQALLADIGAYLPSVA